MNEGRGIIPACYDPQTLGEAIAQRQADLGLSNYQLADAIGCNEATVRNIKLGKTITLERLCLISNALGYPVWALLGEDPPYLNEIRDLLDRLKLAVRSSNHK
ncbi:MAG: helix-turn-helix transcriptional regulator [Geminicoccaceae bacterium]